MLGKRLQRKEISASLQASFFEISDIYGEIRCQLFCPIEGTGVKKCWNGSFINAVINSAAGTI